MDRENFLANIRRSLQTAHLPQAASELPAPLELPPMPPQAELVTRFTAEAEAVNAHVYEVDSPAAALEQLESIFEQVEANGYLGWDDPYLPVPGVHKFLTGRGYQRAVTHLPTDLYAREGVQNDIAAFQVGLTGALAGIADSGTLMLQMGPGRGRFASLLPVVHVAMITAEQLTPSLQHFIRDQPLANFDAANVVAITGPSRTGDIEGYLTLGVHGPRKLHIILLNP